MNECLSCGKPVKNKYCNTSCQNKSRAGKVKSLKSIEKLKKTVYNKWIEFDVICKTCGKKFKIKEFDTIEPKKDFYYCSKKCANCRKQNDEIKDKIRSSIINNLYTKFRIDNIEIDLQEKILELRKDGKTYQEIYLIIDGKLTKENIRLLCNKNGLSHFGRLTEDDIVDIQNLYKELKNIREVTRLTGYSRDTVKSYITINKLSNAEIKQNNIDSVISWRKRTKLKLVEYKGGKCEMCGYDKFIQGLEFHHLDPNEKDFTISGKSWSFEKLKKEVDKCILVCSNCHIEVHYQQI